jgi:hypothetical protein
MKRIAATLAGAASILLGFHLGQSHAQRLGGGRPLEARRDLPTELDVDRFFECARLFKPEEVHGPIDLDEYYNRNLGEFWELYRSQQRLRNSSTREEIREIETPTAANLRAAATRTRDAARKDFLEHLLAPDPCHCTRFMGQYCLPSLSRAMQADLDLATSKQEREKSLWEWWTILKYLEADSTAKYEVGTAGPANHFPVVHARLRVEYELVKSLGK